MTEKLNPTNDMFNLNRFIEAQGDMYALALKEIRQAGKYNHWMWFVFPQIAGLGSSYYAKMYAISSLDEAKAYMAHPILGTRLLECTEAVLEHSTDVCPGFFGSIDAIKLCSCMTLFGEAAPEYKVFQAVLDKFYDGKYDRKTLALLK